MVAFSRPSLSVSLFVRRSCIHMSEDAVNDRHRLTTAGDLRQAGYTAANRPAIHLDPSRVPTALQPLIPLAEQWGIADDVIREDIFRQAGALELEQLRTAV